MADKNGEKMRENGLTVLNRPWTAQKQLGRLKFSDHILMYAVGGHSS